MVELCTAASLRFLPLTSRSHYRSSREYSVLESAFEFGFASKSISSSASSSLCARVVTAASPPLQSSRARHTGLAKSGAALLRYHRLTSALLRGVEHVRFVLLT